jgi:hypothetical protein
MMESAGLTTINLKSRINAVSTFVGKI